MLELDEREAALLGQPMEPSASVADRPLWPAADRRQMREACYRAGGRSFNEASFKQGGARRPTAAARPRAAVPARAHWVCARCQLPPGLEHRSTADIVAYYYHHWKPHQQHTDYLRYVEFMQNGGE